MLQRIGKYKYVGIGVFLMLFGLIGLLSTLPRVAISAQDIGIDSDFNYSIPRIKPIRGYPVGIQIPSVDINLKIADGVFDPSNGSWTLSNDKAHFALPSSRPNNISGNTYIYGHYRIGVFMTLEDIKTGDYAYITTNNGYEFVYKFVGKKTVKPDDTSIFEYQGPPILTLQTCSGLWYQNRDLLYFEFIEVK